LLTINATQGGSGCSQPTLNLAVNQATNQLNSAGFSYDAAGNLTADGVYTYTWGAEGRVTAANGVTYSATITLSASDVGPGQINFSAQVNGDFASLKSEVGYYLGGNSLEDNIWSRLEQNVQAACGGQPTGPG